MRNTAYILLFLSIFCFSNTIYAENITHEDVKNSIKMDEFILNGASQDISENISLFVSLKKTLEGVSSLGWRIALGDKIPSQPVAVIEVLNLIEHDEMEYICPRMFMEGSQNYEMEQWMNRAISSLSSFTMNDPKKESIRKECLEKIKKALAEKDTLK